MLRNARIVVVDDQPADLRLLQTVLGHQGYPIPLREQAEPLDYYRNGVKSLKS